MKFTLMKFLLFIKVFWHRFNENKLSQAAGYLTYSTMLAIVPLIMVIFSFFAAFPVFNDIKLDLKSFIFRNFVPSAGDVVEQYIDTFIANAKQMSAIGVMSLIVVALMLIHSVDTTLNDIWPKTKKRSLVYSFAVYWMILTLGPLLIGASIGVSSYIFSGDIFQGEHALPFELKILIIVPFILTWLTFTMMYAIVPNTKVSIKHAAGGALVAATLFSLGKQVFAWYMLNFHSYQLIYGALAILPLMILWIYLSWTFVLLGAQLTAVLEDMHLMRKGKLDINNLNVQVEYEKAYRHKDL